MFAKSLSVLMFRCLFTLILAAAVLVPPASGTCLPLFSGESWEDGVGQEPTCFRVDVAESSLLVFELGQPATAPRVHLEWLDEGGVETLLHHSPAALVATVAPGVYHLRITADDPTQPLAPFRLRFDRLGVPTKGEGEDDPEIELEPRPLAARCVGCLDLGEGEDDPEIELEPRPLAAVEFRSSDLSRIPILGRERLATLCGADRGDSFLCARRIGGQVLEVRLADATVFRFTVRRLRPVEIRAEGEGIVELYDRHGQRLEVLTGEAGEIRGVRTLVPGVYFLRVEGAYPLRVGVPRR